MPDREKVIYDIERCICHVPDACRDCSHYGHGEVIGCMEELLTDALALLKEQEGYREWMIEMLHKHGRDDLIAIMVPKGDEKILADMLKEQEAVEPNRGLVKTQTAWFCGACGFRLNRAGRFCSKCGKAVKWE